MVRTSVRNITLSVFRGFYFVNFIKKFYLVKDEKILNFITSFPFVSYFPHLACFLKDYWVNIDQILLEQKLFLIITIIKAFEKDNN